MSILDMPLGDAIKDTGFLLHDTDMPACDTLCRFYPVSRPAQIMSIVSKLYVTAFPPENTPPV